MNLKKVRIITMSGLFLLLDRVLKWETIYNWTEPGLVNRYFGWQPFANKGVAFSFPVPVAVTIFITIPIILLIIYLFLIEYNKSNPNLKLIFAWSLVLCGALSNFIDRIKYSYVIDYILLGTALINLADIMIVSGLALFMIHLLKSKS
ncbi:MAG: signal peptidase II [Candidatus Magasanikbacteria bacterium]|nr:signal peptidase II [Candidatus Magasanikbacteria bacterium]